MQKMSAATRRLLPILGVVALGVVLCIGAIVTLGGQRPALVLESSGAEHAVENSFFDELAANDLAKDRRSKNAKDARRAHATALSAAQERAVEDSYFKSVGSSGAKAPHPAARKHAAKHWQPLPYSKLVHRSPFKGAHQQAGAALAKGKKGHPAVSMRAEFHKAQQQLAAEQNKMRHIEEHDHVKAEEQKMKLERLTAHQEAKAYESHLSKLNSAVFPTSMDSDMGSGASHAVSHALTDDMHVPKITKVINPAPSRSLPLSMLSHAQSNNKCRRFLVYHSRSHTQRQADYARHPMHVDTHGSNRLFRRVKNSGKDFAKQVRSAA